MARTELAGKDRCKKCLEHADIPVVVVEVVHLAVELMAVYFKVQKAKWKLIIEANRKKRKSAEMVAFLTIDL